VSYIDRQRDKQDRWNYERYTKVRYAPPPRMRSIAGGLLRSYYPSSGSSDSEGSNRSRRRGRHGSRRPYDLHRHSSQRRRSSETYSSARFISRRLKIDKMGTYHGDSSVYIYIRRIIQRVNKYSKA